MKLVVIATQPPQIDSAYWVWGNVVAGPFFPPMPGAIMIANGQLEVAGWCIQTTPAGLPGTYKGNLTINGAVAPVTLVIAIGAAGTWSFALTDDTGTLSLSVINIVIGDGDLSFDLLVSSPNGIDQIVPVTLASDKNTLSGPLGGVGIGLIPVPVLQGDLSVTRQP